MTIIETAKVFKKNQQAKTRIIVNEGSSRSGKTFSIVQLLIAKALKEKIAVTICRARLTWLKATAFLDFLEIIQNQFKIFDQRSLNKTELIYTLPNKSTIRFIGLDEYQKLHGYKSNLLWLNEAMEIEKNAYIQLTLRTSGQIFIDYNPSAETHWIYDSVIPRDDCTFIKSTYKDNPFLEQSVIDEIERLEPTEHNIKMGTADEVLWKIYGLGERAAHRGLIFGDTDIVKDLPPREEWKKHVYGMDIGFTNDPTTIILVVLCHGELYFKQLLYERRLVNRKDAKNPKQMSIEQRLEELNIPKDARIWADSAEPKSIQELNNGGYFNLKGADKGADSVINGIQNILRYKTHITEDSIDLIKEKNNYKFSEDRDGRMLNKPIDAFNHCWDAIRYATSMEFRLIYEDKYKAFAPSQKLKKGKTIEEKLKYYENRKKIESAF